MVLNQHSEFQLFSNAYSKQLVKDNSIKIQHPPYSEVNFQISIFALDVKNR